MKLAVYSCDLCRVEKRVEPGQGYPRGWMECGACMVRNDVERGNDACEACQRYGCSVPSCGCFVVCLGCHHAGMFVACAGCGGNVCRPDGRDDSCSVACGACNGRICSRCLEAGGHICPALALKREKPTRRRADAGAST